MGLNFYIKKILLLGLLIPLLIGCGSPPFGPYCIPNEGINGNLVELNSIVYASGLYNGDTQVSDTDFYIDNKSNITDPSINNVLSKATNPSSILAYGQWTQVNYAISPGQKFDLTVQGEIDLANQNVSYIVNSSNSNKTDTGTDGSSQIQVKAGDVLIIEVLAPDYTGDGRIDNGASNDCTANDKYPNCNGINGAGLKVYVGNNLQTEKYFRPNGDEIFPSLNDYNTKMTSNIAPGASALAANYNAMILNIKAQFPDSTFNRTIWQFIASDDGVLSFDIENSNSKSGSYSVNARNSSFLSTAPRDQNPYFVEKASNLNSTNDTLAGLEIYISEDSTKPDATVQGHVFNDYFTQAIVAWNTSNPNGNNIWIRVKDNVYTDNVGFYNVGFVFTEAPSEVTLVSNFFTSIIIPVKDQLLDATQAIYANFVGGKDAPNPFFTQAIRAMLTLYIMFYAIYFMLGFTEVTQADLIVRCCKVGIIVALMSNGSWDFFNNYLFPFFTKWPDLIVGAITGQSTNLDPSNPGANVFGFVDKTVTMLFDKYTWLKMSALIFDIVGILLMYFFIRYITIPYVFIIAEAFIAYLLSLIGIYFLISLAPFFISFIMFQRTKQLFDGWLNYLINFSLQPVIMLACLTLVNELIMYIFLGMMSSFEACWGLVVPLWVDLGLIINLVTNGILSSSLTSAFKFQLPFGIPWYKVKNIDTSTMLILAQIIVLFILIKLLKDVLKIGPMLTDAISNLNFSGAFTAVSGQAANFLTQNSNMQKVLGIDEKTKQARKNNAKNEEMKNKFKETHKNSSIEGLRKDVQESEKGGKAGDILNRYLPSSIVNAIGKKVQGAEQGSSARDAGAPASSQGAAQNASAAASSGQGAAQNASAASSIPAASQGAAQNAGSVPEDQNPNASSAASSSRSANVRSRSSNLGNRDSGLGNNPDGNNDEVD